MTDKSKASVHSRSTPKDSRSGDNTGHDRAAQQRSQHSLPHDGQGIVRTEGGEEQPADAERAQTASRANPGDAPPREGSGPDRPEHD